MSLRLLDLANRENANARPANLKKVQSKNVQITNNTKRNAFAEVGNKIHAQTNITKKNDASAPTLKDAATKKAQVKQQKLPPAPNTTLINTKKAPKQEKKKSSETKDFVKVKEVSYSSKRLEEPADPREPNDPLLATEYVQEIYSYLRDMELRFPVQSNFLNAHNSTPRMRKVLINWLVEVHLSFTLLPETLHLTVGVLDRYLQVNKTVGTENLQLVGASALLIACKYEEMFPPPLSDFEYVVDYSFTKQDILDMEIKMLHELNWCLGRPLPLHFLRRFSKVARVQPEHHALGKYLLELALFEYELCHLRPSLLAAAATCLSITILDELPNAAAAWTAALADCSTYAYADIRSVLFTLAHALLNSESSKYQAIRSKYAASNVGKISTNPKLKSTIVKCLAIKVNKGNAKPLK